MIRPLLICCLLATPSLAIPAQGHVHTPGMTHPAEPGRPTEAGQAAFAAIAEVVRLLEADPATDWSKVNLDGLRQHLVDMDEVMMRADVRQDTIPGGVQFTITGSGRTRAAIQRMVPAHASVLNAEPGIRATAETIATGARLRVTAATAVETRAVVRLRGLGFWGLLTTGDHHGPHHLAMARGTTDAHAGHH